MEISAWSLAFQFKWSDLVCWWIKTLRSPWNKNGRLFFNGILQAEILQGSFTGSCLEYPGLNNGDALEVLHGCLDPSILSIFEDSPTGEVNNAYIKLFIAWFALNTRICLLNFICFHVTQQCFLFFFFRLNVILMRKAKQRCSQLSLKYLTMLMMRTCPLLTLCRIQTCSQGRRVRNTLRWVLPSWFSPV